MAIQGDLDDIGLTNLLQLMCAEQRMGAVFLYHRGDEGSIYFEGGQIVHAEASELSGEHAVYRLLSWTDGRFRVSKLATPSKRTIALDWNYLLMEAMRQIDETRHDGNGHSKPVADEPGNVVQMAQDASLESDVLATLGGFEQVVVGFDNKTVKKRPVIVLENLCQLVNDVVALTERVRRGGGLGVSLVQTVIECGHRYPQARLLHITNNRLSVQTVVNLYRNWGDDPADRSYLFRQIGRAQIEAIRIFLSVLTHSYHDEARAAECRDTCSVFLDDLGRAFEAVTF